MTGVERYTITLIGGSLGTVADLRGRDARSSLLLNVIDSFTIDSTEIIREEATALV